MMDRVGPRGPGNGNPRTYRPSLDIQRRLREKSHPITCSFRPIAPADVRSIAARGDATEVRSFLAPHFSSQRVLSSLEIAAQKDLMELMAQSLAVDSRLTIDRVVSADNQDIVNFAKTHDLELYPLAEVANNGGGAKVIALKGGEVRPRTVFMSKNDRRILAIKEEIDKAMEEPESRPYVISKLERGNVQLGDMIIPALGVSERVDVTQLTQEVLVDLVFASDDKDFVAEVLNGRLSVLLDNLLVRFLAKNRSENSPTYLSRVVRAVFLTAFDPLVTTEHYEQAGDALFVRYHKLIHPEEHLEWRKKRELQDHLRRHPEIQQRLTEQRMQLFGLIYEVLDDAGTFPEDMFRLAPSERRYQVCKLFEFDPFNRGENALAKKLLKNYSAPQPPPAARVTQATPLVPPVVKNPLAFLIMPMVSPPIIPPPEPIELVPGRGAVTNVTPPELIEPEPIAISAEAWARGKRPDGYCKTSRRLRDCGNLGINFKEALPHIDWEKWYGLVGKAKREGLTATEVREMAIISGDIVIGAQGLLNPDLITPSAGAEPQISFPELSEDHKIFVDRERYLEIVRLLERIGIRGITPAFEHEFCKDPTLLIAIDKAQITDDSTPREAAAAINEQLMLNTVFDVHKPPQVLLSSSGQLLDVQTHRIGS